MSGRGPEVESRTAGMVEHWSAAVGRRSVPVYFNVRMYATTALISASESFPL